jgi:hypothetical protein
MAVAVEEWDGERCSGARSGGVIAVAVPDLEDFLGAIETSLRKEHSCRR